MVRIAPRCLLFALMLVLTVPIALPLEAADSAQRKRFKNVTRVFTQEGDIDVDPFDASPYPSSLEVSGLRRGRIKDVDLILRGFSHEQSYEVDILLVKDGRDAMVLSDVGSSDEVTNLTLTLDDEAATTLPENALLTSGTFRPTDVIGLDDIIYSPAPTPSGNAALATFDGLNPNGTWRRFVMDQAIFKDGIIASWELRITARVRTKR